MNTTTDSLRQIPQFKPKDKLYQWTEKRGGKIRQGEIWAPFKSIALQRLKKLQVRPSAIKLTKETSNKSIPLKIKGDLIRQLAVMMESGVPLAQALDMIAQSHKSGARGNVRRLVLKIKADVESGTKPSDAFRKHPSSFDPLFCNTLKAGEDAGKIEEALQRLAIHLEKTYRNRQRVRKALTYPVAVIIIAIALTVCMLLFVIPTFSGIYAQFTSELPSLTKGLITAWDFLKENGLCLALFIACGLVVTTHLYRTRKIVRDKLDGIFLRSPIVGHLIKSAAFARWIRTLSTLNASGVPVVAALESVASTCRFSVHERATRYIKDEVRSGSKISEAMIATAIFPREMSQMIQIGEESGKLDTMMERIANRHELQFDDLVDNLTTVIEPVFMSVFGLIGGVLIVGMYLPIFNMGSIV